MRTLVTSYRNPDLDGYACAVAYAELLRNLGREADARMSSTVHPEAQYVAAQLGMEPIPLISVTDYAAFVLVDTSDPVDIDPSIPIQHVTEVIDHRTTHNAAAFKNARIDIQLVGAAATLITERFQQQKQTPSKEAATLLHAAIVSNTLNFQGNVTTQRDRDAAVWLQQFSSIDQKFIHQMFLAKSDLAGEKLLSTIENGLAVFSHGNKTIAYAQLEIIGAADLVARRKAEIEDILAEIKEREGATYTFLSIIDLEKNQNIFVSIDANILLEQIIQLEWENSVAVRQGIIMRKELRPLIKEFFS